MAQYWKIKKIVNEKHRAHVAKRLRALKTHLRENVTEKTSERDLRLATWNLMHFGAGGGYERDIDALLYISEIIDHFDLVAIQEVKPDLSQLKDLIKNYLGLDWDYIVTDATGGRLGNNERMAYLYRKSKVKFSRLAGEIVLEEGKTIVGESDVKNSSLFAHHKQFSRSPFIVGFRCGWFHFKLCTVHIYFGAPGKRPEGMSDENWERLRDEYMLMRKTEIQEIANFLAKKHKNDRKLEIKNLIKKKWETEQSKVNFILLGDFNIISPQHETFEALTKSGFEIPEKMKELHTTLGKTKRHYDQIAYLMGDKRVRHRESDTINFRDLVFRREDAEHYIDVVKDSYISGAAKSKDNKPTRDRAAQIKYFNTHRYKHQMSDHQLLWASFKVDFSEHYLEQVE